MTEENENWDVNLREGRFWWREMKMPFYSGGLQRMFHHYECLQFQQAWLMVWRKKSMVTGEWLLYSLSFFLSFLFKYLGYLLFAYNFLFLFFLILWDFFFFLSHWDFFFLLLPPLFIINLVSFIFALTIWLNMGN